MKAFFYQSKLVINCIAIDEKVCIVKNIAISGGIIYRVYKSFKAVKNFFQYPFQSELLNVREVDHLCDELSVVQFCDVQSKCLLLSFNDDFVAMPLRHQNN